MTCVKKPFKRSFSTRAMYDGKIYFCGGYVDTVMKIHLKEGRLVCNHCLHAKRKRWHQEQPNFPAVHKNLVDTLSIPDEES